jgi:hypothetical protein
MGPTQPPGQTTGALFVRSSSGPQGRSYSCHCSRRAVHVERIPPPHPPLPPRPPAAAATLSRREIPVDPSLTVLSTASTLSQVLLCLGRTLSYRCGWFGSGWGSECSDPTPQQRESASPAPLEQSSARTVRTIASPPPLPCHSAAQHSSRALASVAASSWVCHKLCHVAALRALLSSRLNRGIVSVAPASAACLVPTRCRASPS